MEYTLIYIFTEMLEEVLLVKKNRGPYVGVLNGVGGKIEDYDSSEISAAYRELLEETSISSEMVTLIPLTTIKSHINNTTVNIFFGIISNKNIVNQNENEELKFYRVSDIMSYSDDMFPNFGDVKQHIIEVKHSMGTMQGVRFAYITSSTKLHEFINNHDFITNESILDIRLMKGDYGVLYINPKNIVPPGKLIRISASNDATFSQIVVHRYHSDLRLNGINIISNNKFSIIIERFMRLYIHKSKLMGNGENYLVYNAPDSFTTISESDITNFISIQVPHGN